MTPRVSDFPSLIRWIADHHHDGVVKTIAKEIGVSVPLVNQWVHGVVENPRTGNLLRLSQRYDIDFMFIIRLVARGRKPIPISGGSAAALPQGSLNHNPAGGTISFCSRGFTSCGLSDSGRGAGRTLAAFPMAA